MKILIVSSIDQTALETLRAHHDVICAFNADAATLASHIQDREVLIFRSGVSITADVMAKAPALKLLIRAGSGIDNVDMEYIQQRGITFTRIPEPSAQAVAEMSFALMLALARNVREADLLTRQGHWAKNQLSGYLLSGKVLGIVGTGNIGSRVGQLGAAWGMQPIGCVEFPSAGAVAHLHEKGIRLTDFAEVISTADFVSIHVPFQASTRNLINAHALSSMKPGAFLINLARGGVVDEQALYAELTTTGRLRGAALDVHQEEGEGKISPLAGLPNVILTPHIGANTVDTQREIGRRIVAILNDFIALSVAQEEQRISFAYTTPVSVY
jgi:D-3-phosphoglycerate dehydrogenase / 2-oxoglutarate reductase